MFSFTCYLKMNCSLIHFYTNVVKNYYIRGSLLKIVKHVTMNLILISKVLFLMKQEWDNLVIQLL